MRSSHGSHRWDLLLAVLGALVLAAIATTAIAPGPASPEVRARAIESQLRCPVCQGLSIADSPAELAVQMRAIVAERMADGASDDEIRDYFVTRYGRWILLVPRPEGPDVMLWMAPGALLLAGALIIVVRRRDPYVPDVGRGIPEVSRRPGPASRTAVGGILIGMAAAIAVPLTVAIVPRTVGQEITGSGAAIQSAPSIAELEALTQAEPSDAGALVSLGDAYLASGRAPEAADLYKRVLERDPSNIGALLQLGVLLLASDRPAAAGPIFDRILAIDAEQPEALLHRAIARARAQGSATLPEASRADLLRFLALSPVHPLRSVAESMLAGSPSPTQFP